MFIFKMNDYDDLILQLDANIYTHPNLSLLWKNYLRIKREKYLKSIIQCRMVIEKMHTVPDIDYNSLLCLYIIYQLRIE